MSAEHPRVRVVVVNHNGGDSTLACLSTLERTEWPHDRLDLVLVDNASDDGTVLRVRRDHPRVRVLANERNIGFAGGNNVALRDRVTVDHIALVNPDALVPPGWLTPLVDALKADPELGAVCPKILLTGRYAEVRIASSVHQRGRGDRRDVGVCIIGVRVRDRDATGRTRFVSGTWGPEPGGRWTNAAARLLVPLDEGAPRSAASFQLASDTPTTVTVDSGGEQFEHAVGTSANWYSYTLAGPPMTVINNVGTELVTDGYGADRGWLEPDCGQYDAPAEVFAWCGAAVLLRRAYLDDVGLFDERLFLYCEDLEVAWRGRARGWRYRTVPTSVVLHEHSASTVEGSELFDFYNERNHLLVVARHGSPGLAFRAWVHQLLVTASYFRRDVVIRWLRGVPAEAVIVRRRVRALASAARLLPAMIASRVRDARGHRC